MLWRPNSLAGLSREPDLNPEQAANRFTDTLSLSGAPTRELTPTRANKLELSDHSRLCTLTLSSGPSIFVRIGARDCERLRLRARVCLCVYVLMCVCSYVCVHMCVWPSNATFRAQIASAAVRVSSASVLFALLETGGANLLNVLGGRAQSIAL